MKIKFSPLLLKIVILISALIGIASIIWNTVHIFRLGPFAMSSTIPGVKAMVVEHSIMGALYALMAVYLFKLVGGTSNREIICRRNLMSVKRILYILFALLLTKIVFAPFTVFGLVGGTRGIAFKLIMLMGSSWELVMASLVIYVLATVFKRAVILKEEEALTI